MTLADTAYLETFAKAIRYHTLATLNHLGFGHYGGSLSIAELLAVLYGYEMTLTPQMMDSQARDHFILSKGHAGPALYSTLYLKGFFNHDFLWSLNTNGTRLPSHPDRNLTPGIDMTTGSLGQGISVATGVAYGQKMADLPYYTYCLVGDGELNEGQCWEAAQFAAHQDLSHLIVCVDDNHMQLDGSTDSICRSFDLVAKFQAFGWEAMRVKGHDISELLAAFHTVKTSESPKPKCLVLETIKGHGVSVVENLANSHHLRPSGQLKVELQVAAQQLAKEVEGFHVR